MPGAGIHDPVDPRWGLLLCLELDDVTFVPRGIEPLTLGDRDAGAGRFDFP